MIPLARARWRKGNSHAQLLWTIIFCFLFLLFVPLLDEGGIANYFTDRVVCFPFCYHFADDTCRNTTLLVRYYRFYQSNLKRVSSIERFLALVTVTETERGNGVVILRRNMSQHFCRANFFKCFELIIFSRKIIYRRKFCWL